MSVLCHGFPPTEAELSGGIAQSSSTVDATADFISVDAILSGGEEALEDKCVITEMGVGGG